MEIDTIFYDWIYRHIQGFMLSPESLQSLVVSGSLDQLRETLSKFSISDYAESFALLQKNETIDFKEKLQTLVETIEALNQWESLGQALTVEQFMAFLNAIDSCPEVQSRLSFLLVGLRPSVFSAALSQLQEEHLALFKDKDLFEPLQFQLTQIVHEGESLYQQTNIKLEQIEKNTLRHLCECTDD